LCVYWRGTLRDRPVSISNMGDSGPWLRRRVRLTALLTVVVVLLLCSPVVVYDLTVYWQARSLIRALKTIRVGKTTGRDAVKIAERFGGQARTFEETFDNHVSTLSMHDVPFGTCVAGDCQLWVHVDPGFPGLKFLRNLWIDHPGFRRRLPMNLMGGYLEIKQGVVQELEVGLGSIDEEIQHSASTHIYGQDSHATPQNRTPWSVRKVAAHMGGGPPNKLSEIRVEAWPSAPQDRILRAFDFDLRCLWLGMHCSRCGVLPSACEDYSHGDWYEFVMPAEALAKFRQAVNNLKLGTQESAIYDQLGSEDGFDTRRRLSDLARDRLPFDFPEGTILGSSGPEGVTYYVKKWRIDRGAPEGPDDRSVTFVLDNDRRLQRIESRVEGITSRP
jgi:hypothetical protein